MTKRKRRRKEEFEEEEGRGSGSGKGRAGTGSGSNKDLPTRFKGFLVCRERETKSKRVQSGQEGEREVRGAGLTGLHTLVFQSQQVLLCGRRRTRRRW